MCEVFPLQPEVISKFSPLLTPTNAQFCNLCILSVIVDCRIVQLLVLPKFQHIEDRGF